MWSVIRKLADKIGEGVTTHMRAIARENPLLQGIIDRVDFNTTTHVQRVRASWVIVRLTSNHTLRSWLGQRRESKARKRHFVGSICWEFWFVWWWREVRRWRSTG